MNIDDVTMDAKWYAEWVRLLPASSGAEKTRNLEAADVLESQAEEIEHLKATLKAAEADIRELLLRGLRGHEVPACVYCAVEDANDCDEHGCINIARWRGTKEETK